MKFVSCNVLGAAMFAAATVMLSACGSSTPLGGSPAASGGDASGIKTFKICPGPDAQKETLIALFDSHEGDTIEFCEGQFDFTTGLVLTGKRGITIKGQGKDKTVLSFLNSESQDGVNINRVTGIIVQGLTIYDAPGNGLRIFRCDYVTVRDVKVGWSIADNHSPSFFTSRYSSDPMSWKADGSYAFYPVLSHKILIEDSVSVGSSDAGVYVGQSNDILVRRTEAYHNVAGFEFENTYRAEFVDNIAHDNVAGFLVFDLPGRAQFGEKNLVHHNTSFNNNIPTFAPRGAIVGDVPSGTGMLLLAGDQLELYDNDIHDNNFTGFAIANYGLIDPNESSTEYDFYPEGLHVYNNTFTDNGGSPPLPDISRDGCKGTTGLPAGVPGISDLNTQPDCIANNASLLPTILVVKNLGKSAQIVWDGGVDPGLDTFCTDVPTDRDGIPLTQPNPNDTGRYEPRADERGRPNLYIYDPHPVCKPDPNHAHHIYNAWKFNANGSLKKPQMGMCIESSNKFLATKPQNILVDNFINAHFSTPDPTNPANLAPVEHTLPSDCPTVAPALLPQFVPVLGSFTPDPKADPRPTDAEIAAACGGGNATSINYAALAKYNCPRLDQYGLFKDPADPRKDPNGLGVPFDLNTILFSDYAVKYRFLFLPPDASGNPQKALYEDHTKCDTISIYDCFTATLGFPVGTVFAKTFAFRDGANEDVAETRLLIKRQLKDGTPSWVGFAYEWTTDASGHRVANLKIEGDTKAETWNYDDPDADVKDATGKPQHYQGSADHYGIPNAGACLQCHSGDDREPGTAPIGLKVRNLNKDHDFGGSTGVVNQLALMQMKAMLDLPDDPSKLEKMPKWNVPGSTGETPDSPADKHKRVRAFLEVNCMHCHNPAGGAQNSGLSLDAFNEPMDEGHGICKPPIAAGKAADVGNYDIQPGNASQSILPYRVTSTQPGIKMPPLARTVEDTEFVTLLNDWVNNVVTNFADPNSNTCGGSGLPLKSLPIEMMKVVE